MKVQVRKLPLSGPPTSGHRPSTPTYSHLTRPTGDKSRATPSIIHNGASPPRLLRRLPRAFLMLQPAYVLSLLLLLLLLLLFLSIPSVLLILSFLNSPRHSKPPGRSSLPVGSRSSAVGQVTSHQTTASNYSSSRTLAALFSTSILHPSIRS